MSPVHYENLIYTDKREGKPTFLDLNYLDDFSEVNSCLNFQFSQPEEIIAGRVDGKSDKYIMAAVGEDIFANHSKVLMKMAWYRKLSASLTNPKVLMLSGLRVCL